MPSNIDMKECRFEMILGLYYYCPTWLSDTGVIQTIDRIDWSLLE